MADNSLQPNKVPLTSLATLFNQLGPATKSQLMSALTEAETQLNTHNNSVVGTNKRRKRTTAIDQPVLTTTLNNRGFAVDWTRLDDRTISLYEIQISTDSIFSNPDVYRVVDTSFALDGIGATVYARVRGVRFDGSCSLWSDPATIEAFAQSGGPVVYSKGLDSVRDFYKADAGGAFPQPIQKLTITSQRTNGGVMVFGSMGVAGSGGSNVGDFVSMSLNGQTLSSIDMSTIPFDASGNNSFSVGLGPTFLTHAQFYFSTDDIHNPTTEVSTGSSGGVGTGTGWTFNGNGAVGSMETVYPLPPTNNNASYTVTGLVPGSFHDSKQLNLTNFGFSVPSNNTILGILVEFTGAWQSTNQDTTKSFPTIKSVFLIDDTGTVGSTMPISANSVQWPYLAPFTAGGELADVLLGSSSYLWGELAGFWTPAKINNSNFGVSVRSHHSVRSTDTIAAGWIAVGQQTSSTAYLYGVQVTVFSENPTDRSVRIEMKYHSTTGNGTGLSGAGTCVGATINAIEFGDVLSS
jgi:hypothetical protein